MPIAFVALAVTSVPLRFAALDITPAEPLPLGGYTDRKGVNFEPGGQPLYARVTEIGDVLIVSMETLTIPRGFYDVVQSALGTRKLFLVATHTHCAPDSQMLNPRMNFAVPGIASYRPSVSQWYAGKVVKAVVEADSSTAVYASRLTLKTTKVKLNHARRVGARPDRQGWMLEADDKVLLASYAAHATFHDSDWLKLDGDWPGGLASRLNAPVLPGAIGDVSPESIGADPVEKSRNFVENFCSAVQKRKPTTVWKQGQKTAFVEVPIKLAAPTPHKTFAKQYGVPDALAQVLVGKFAEPQAKVTAASWGSFAIVGIPGEPTAAVGKQIQSEARKQGFPHCLVVSHVNGWIGYILEPKDYDRGGYEATLSFNGRETALRVEEAAREALKTLASPRQRLGRGSATAGN